MQTPVIRITYQTVTPESAEYGDYADQGWVDEEGVSMAPDLFDIADGVSAVGKAVEFLRDQGAWEPSSWPNGGPGTWYTDTDAVVDYRTGAETTQSYHLSGFNPSQERLIYSLLAGRV